MSAKKTMILLGVAIFSLLIFTASSCDDDNNNSTPTPPSCQGIVSASATGYVSATICCNVAGQFYYVEGEKVELWANQEGEPNYGVVVNALSYDGGFTGAGIYNCGPNDIGYVELIIHGNENEFYKSQSGTLYITQVNTNILVATFDVIAVGYYNGETINFSGSVSYAVK